MRPSRSKRRPIELRERRAADPVVDREPPDRDDHGGIAEAHERVRPRAGSARAPPRSGARSPRPPGHAARDSTWRRTRTRSARACSSWSVDAERREPGDELASGRARERQAAQRLGDAGRLADDQRALSLARPQDRGRRHARAQAAARDRSGAAPRACGRAAAGWVAIRAYATRPVSTPERISADLVICRLAQLATPGGETGQPLRGAALGDVEVHDGDMWIAAYAGEIVAVGHGHEIRELLDLDDGAIIIDAPGLVAVPGLIDCHTHACFAGDRVEEFEQRSRGASYEEIHASGGGILSTVRATREASQPELAAITRRALAGDARARHDDGRGQVGLRPRRRDRDRDAARDPGGRLRVGRARHGHLSSRRTPCPDEAESADAYIQLCIDEILPELVGVGPRRGRRRVLRARRVRRRRRRGATSRPRATTGLALRLHGDQFAEIGALDLAIELERALHRPSRGDRPRGHREARGLRRRRRRAADRRAHARPAAAARPRARRRRRPARARHRLQPRLEPVRLAARRHAPRLHAAATSRRPRRSRP